MTPAKWIAEGIKVKLWAELVPVKGETDWNKAMTELGIVVCVVFGCFSDYQETTEDVPNYKGSIIYEIFSLVLRNLTNNNAFELSALRRLQELRVAYGLVVPCNDLLTLN